MSGGSEIDWAAVAKELIRILGVETARGFYYALLIQSAYPTLASKVTEFIHSRDERKLEELRDILARQGIALQYPPAQQYPPYSSEQLARMLAEELRKTQAAGYSPRLGSSLEIISEIEGLKREIAMYEDIRASLLRQKYLEFDSEKLKQIEDRIKEVEREIDVKRSRLRNLQAIIA